MPSGDGGLGASLVGDKVTVGALTLHVTKMLGEGGFSYVYLVKEISEMSSSLHVDPSKVGKGDEAPVRRSSGPGASNTNGSGSGGKDEKKVPLVLKVTSIHSRAQRDIAEKEAKLLSRLSHPSIIKIYDTCYRTVPSSSGGGGSKSKGTAPKDRPQHIILMEYCEGGHALDVCSRLAANNKRFDLPTLIIAFGQICNAVSYLHAQRPPIVHRDLKPVNFLVKNGAYKLCDFGSAVFGHVDLRTPKARAEAEEVIQKTTTQMFRAPEMVDLYMAKKLTQATDVWALGCCLYSLAFLQNCFEEGSNLAILSGKYTIPEDNPYGEGLVELLDRMLTSDCKARADMTEVILCLSAVYSGRPLPPRKKPTRSSKTEGTDDADAPKKEDEDLRKGSYRTDGQGIQQPVYDPTKATEGKKLASNSVAARRKRAAVSASHLPPTAPSSSSNPASAPAADTADPLDFTAFGSGEKVDDSAFGSDVGFGEMKGFETKGEGDESDFFGSFDKAAAVSQDGTDGFDAAFDGGAWGDSKPATDSGNGQEDPPADSQSDVQDDGGDSGGEKGDGLGDSQRKGDRSARRRRGPGGTTATTRSTRPGGSIEAGVEALNVSEGDGSGDRKSRSSKAEEADRRRRRSGSRSRRKGRPSKGDREGEDPAPAADKERRAQPKGTAVKKMPSRGKAPDP